MLCQADSVRINGGNRAVSGKTQADCFRQAVHGICRIHAGAGSARRADFFLILTHLIFRHRACGICAHGLKHGRKTPFFTLHAACQHRSAGYKHRRQIKPRRRHEQTGHIFIAIRHHDERVELMRHRHAFRGIRNQVSRHEGIFHADMPHGNPVADRNRRKDDGHAARFRNAELHGLDNLVQIHMTGHDFIIGTDNPDHGLVHFFFRKTKSMKKASVGRLLHPLAHCVTSHD